MKIPKRLTLFGEEYNIKLVSQEQMNKLTRDHGTLGHMEPFKREIHLVKNDKELTNTFWHEIGHYYNQTIIGQDNETLANSFAQLITEVNRQLKLK